MQYENETKITSLFSIEVLASFAITIGMLVDFNNRISGQFAGADLSAGVARYGYFMVAMTFISIIILFIYGGVANRGGLFIWLPVLYVSFAYVTTILSGLYPVARLPFRFIELFYWVAVMMLSYYSVLRLKTVKFHVAIVVLAIPFLSYTFFVMRGAETSSLGFLVVGFVYFISYLMPIVLLLRSKVLKVSGLLLIFIVIVLSYKRMAILAYSTSILVYFYYLSKTSSKAGLWRTITVFLGAIMFIAILAFSFRYLSGALGLDWFGRMGGIVAGGGSGRIGIWRDILVASVSQDFIYWFIGRGYLATEPLGWAHNDFLEILYDFGLIGLTIYLMFVAKIVRIFFEMKRLKYRHVDAFAVSLVWFAWGSMFSQLVIYPYWFLGMALFWGITIADFENAKMQGYVSEIDDSLHIGQYYDETAEDIPYT